MEICLVRRSLLIDIGLLHWNMCNVSKESCLNQTNNTAAMRGGSLFCGSLLIRKGLFRRSLSIEIGLFWHVAHISVQSGKYHAKSSKATLHRRWATQSLCARCRRPPLLATSYAPKWRRHLCTKRVRCVTLPPKWVGAAIHCNTLQHTTARCSTLQHTATRYGTLEHTSTLCNTLQQSATHCSTLQHTATNYNKLQHTVAHCNALHHTAPHCNTRQHTATHCNTLQHTATHCNTLQHTAQASPTQK